MSGDKQPGSHDRGAADRVTGASTVEPPARTTRQPPTRTGFGQPTDVDGVRGYVVAVTTAEDLRRLAAERFGWTRLRADQFEAMRLVMAGHDVLAVLPTGSGKSAIYQVPALLLDGPTVVVSPLIALQRDQIEGIEDSRAPQAVALNSAQRKSERDEAWQAVRDGTAEYVFVSPEQLANEDVRAGPAALGVSLFVVEEAHWVSAGGHAFRPEYLRLGQVIERMGRPRVVAPPATAAPPVRADIADRL